MRHVASMSQNKSMAWCKTQRDKVYDKRRCVRRKDQAQMCQKQSWLDASVYHANRNCVTMKNLSSMVAPEVVKMTTSGAASDNKHMTTFP